ncbi:hypothetical protein C475_04616 [Halosimplex carlsbadense 2-9-1]|uniref:Uncharacterized protein n=1 Tax=Halosimplex carlsbadense 2-9-1 TaxID=797114 RepID=M0D057_9EURY|nr:hypothetical protein [Halosimplex carlsbadense]ELZ28891.1 hypothetical protein C475_04616 [Halosimplex carlsbadense 2-9-1]
MSQNRPVLLAVLALLVAAPATQVVAAGSLGTGSASLPERALEPDGGPTPGASVAAQQSAPTDAAAQQNRSNYLGINDEAVETADYQRAGLNVGGALQRDVAALQGEYASLTFERRYENTTKERPRTALLREEVSRLGERVQRLELRRNRLLDDYNAGEVSEGEFLREVAAIDRAARVVGDRFTRIRGATGLELPSGLDTKMNNLEGDLLSLRGPVRAQVGAAMAGERPPVPVYAVTSQTGIVLSSVDRSQYYREAYLGQNREEVGPDLFVTEGSPNGVVAAVSRMTELYPWASSNSRSGPNVEGIGNTSIYYVSLRHSHGSLGTYLDGRTESPFREIQTKSLEATPRTATTNASQGVELTVNRTHATGPMQISVRDNLTGDALEANVTINGDDVGSTGADGELWTLTPKQAVRLEVTTSDGRTVRDRFFAS